MTEPIKPGPQPVTDAAGRLVEEIWPLALDGATLDSVLRDLFTNHWASISFGPLVEGGAYELRCPGPPLALSTSDGYLTVHWGRAGHFHLCIGTNQGPASSPTPADLRAHRRPGRAEFFRGRGDDGHPVTWGFRMLNGRGEQQITVFFPNPFLTEDDRIAAQPDFDRLAVWETVTARHVGWTGDGCDRLGRGFAAP